ncbi:TrbM/KikA/MpfK family conjugal transfer protein [Castellaniella sp.]|uniref:TrbM/KikA/MpfK family conjugal transfer protein n=1 Tax=Castellaniella sp. TaxID=1955812 RepID=UPI002AFF72C6|nr:TrbM/KikA/MpfK family conjugal transfer protein [Castellaniella sp.]
MQKRIWRWIPLTHQPSTQHPDHSSARLRPGECSPSLEHYFGIKRFNRHGLDWDATVAARRSFLGQCPAAADPGMPERGPWSSPAFCCRTPASGPKRSMPIWGIGASMRRSRNTP